MQRMADAEIEAHLAAPHQAVLSVNRDMRGPLAVPMSFLFRDGAFFMVTSPDSLHGRLMRSEGRATLTIHHEEYPPGRVSQWYIVAEGPVSFTNEDPEPIVRAVIAKDRPAADAPAWAARAAATATSVARLDPTSLSGHVFEAALDE